MSDIDRVNIDIDPSLIPLQASGTEIPPTLINQPGSSFVVSFNAQTGPVVIAGGTSGFTFPSGAGTITLTSPLTTKGDLYTHNGTNGVRFAVGTDGFALISDSTQTSGLNWFRILPPTYTAPALLNSWVNFGGAFSTAGYLLHTGVVRLKGTIKNGVAGGIMTLPAGYRPAATMILPVITDTGLGTITIDNAGAVTQTGGGTGTLTLDGISFVAGQ